MELFKGINQIQVPLPGNGDGNVNVYIIEGTTGNLMIDTGWNTADSFNTLAHEMKSSGFAMKDITHVAITHAHPDHFGLAGKIADLTGAKIFLSDIEYNMLDLRYWHPEGLLGDIEAFLKSHGVPDWELKMLVEASLNLRNNVATLKDIEILKPGDRIPMEPFEFQVVLTPGHSAGHICLYEPQKKYLFTGDHVLAETLPHVGYHPQSGKNPLGDYITSLDTLAKLEIRFVFPGHGSVFSGLLPKIDDIMRLHNERMVNMQKVMGIETKNAFDVARIMNWGLDGEPLNYDKLEPVARRQAILQTLAYLQYMVAENRGKIMTENDKIIYWSGE